MLIGRIFIIWLNHSLNYPLHKYLFLHFGFYSWIYMMNLDHVFQSRVLLF